MSVTEYVSRQGSFGIATENIPRSLWRSLQARCKKGLLVIRAGRIDPGAGVAGLVDGALYCGVIERFTLGGGIEGGSIVRWMGDEQGKGAGYITEPYTATLDFEDWVTAVIGSPSLLPYPIRLGGAESGGSTKELTVGPCTRRQALDVVCDAFGKEWKITPDGYVWAGDPVTYLYWAAPEALFTSRYSGRTLTVEAFQVRAQSAALDGYDACNHLETSYETGGITDYVAVTLGGTQNYDDPLGDPITLTRWVDKPTAIPETISDTEEFAEFELARYGLWDREVALEVDDTDVPDRLMLGCPAGVHVPELEMVDLTNQVHYQGAVLHPESVRLVGWTWPVHSRRSVAVVTSDGNGSDGQIFDITDWVVPESGPTRVEFGRAGQRVLGETKLT